MSGDAAAAMLAPEDLEADFFGDAAPPKPALYDVATIVENARCGGARPVFIPLSGRDACDPRGLAQMAHAKDMRASEVKELLAARHTPLARVIYPSQLDFRRAFDDALREIEHKEAAAPPKGVVLFDPPPNNPLRPGKHHNLDKLMRETLAKGEDFIPGRTLRHDGKLEWTTRFIKGWFGMADFEGPFSGRIRINVLLNSADFPAEALRFLLWHEYLHIHLRALHTPEFRRLEQLWPAHAACNRELDNLEEKFGVQYWK